MKKLSIAVLILFLTQTLHGDPGIPEVSSFNQPLAVIPPDQYLNFDALKEIIISKKIKSIEEALSILSKSYSEYFKFHTLMYKSLSRHQASFLEPRAIVFGPEARFILTFNGGYHQRGGNSFETSEYSYQSHSFLFREVAFKNSDFNPAELGLEEKEIAFQNENLIISQSNPAKCLRCHANASPLWATYFLWPGAYGSNDDQLQMSFDRASWSENTRDFMQTSDRPQSQGRLMGFKSGMADTELEGMINYLKAKPSHARYQWLPSQIAEEGLLRYAGGEAFAKLDLSDKFLAERQRVKADPSWPSRPNLFFQKALMRLNQDRLMAQLEKAGLKNAFKSPAWNVLSQSLSHLKSDEPLRELATFLQRAISQFEFKGPKPEIAEIEALLKENLKDEISMQRTKLNLHQSGVGAGSLEFFNPHYKCSRNVFCWLRDPLKFYSKLLDLKQVSELDKMAFNTETEDPVAMTLLAILLKDRGIDLHHYNMNFRQVSLSFYEGGLLEVGKYLGIEDFLE